MLAGLSFLLLAYQFVSGAARIRYVEDILLKHEILSPDVEFHLISSQKCPTECFYRSALYAEHGLFPVFALTG